MNEQYNIEMANLNQGFSGIGRAMLERKLRAQKMTQQAFENKMREQMLAMQQRSNDASIANAERDFGYRKERDQVGDTRYTDQTGYTRGRDQVADTRYTDQTQYSRGRDQVGDKRYEDQVLRQAGRDFTDDNMKHMELGLRMQALKDRGNVGGYVTEELDDEGNVIGTRRRVPIRTGAAGGAPANGNVVKVQATGPDGKIYTYHVPKDQFEQFRQTAEKMGATGQDDAGGNAMTPAQLLEAVKTGKMTKDQAKAYARKHGLN